MPRGRARRWERAALTVALAVGAACAAVLLLSGGDDDHPVARATVTTQAPTTTTTVLAPGCAAMVRLAESQDAADRLSELLVQVYQDPAEPVAVQATVDALDEFTNDQLPQLADALNELATALPEHRRGVIALQRFVVEVIRALETSATGTDIVAVLEGVYAREDAATALSAVGPLVAYGYERCPQPID
jgi:HEAT repeat protein